MLVRQLVFLTQFSGDPPVRGSPARRALHIGNVFTISFSALTRFERKPLGAGTGDWEVASDAWAPAKPEAGRCGRRDNQ